MLTIIALVAAGFAQKYLGWGSWIWWAIGIVWGFEELASFFKSKGCRMIYVIKTTPIYKPLPKDPPPNLRQKFWAAVCRYAFRRAFRVPRIAPTGLPGHRDPEHICASFWPVKTPSGTGQCQTDGHYLCRECEWMDPQAEAMSE